jgi:hypothetical protein
MAQENIISLDDAPAPMVADTPKKGKKAEPVEHKPVDEGFSGKMVRVIINEGTDDMGKEPVDVGVNGKAWRIKRNEEVLIPVEVFGVIKNAVQISYAHNSVGIEERKVHRFSFQTLGNE